jgi:hypothetical protein
VHLEPLGEQVGGGLVVELRSMMVTLAWPPPSHIVCEAVAAAGALELA